MFGMQTVCNNTESVTDTTPIGVEDINEDEGFNSIWITQDKYTIPKASTDDEMFDFNDMMKDDEVGASYNFKCPSPEASTDDEMFDFNDMMKDDEVGASYNFKCPSPEEIVNRELEGNVKNGQKKTTESTYTADEKLSYVVNLSDMLKDDGPYDASYHSKRPSPDEIVIRELASNGKKLKTQTTDVNIGAASRFKSVGPLERQEMTKPNIPPNTLKKTFWAVKLYNDWVAHVIHVREDPKIVAILEKEKNILNLTSSELNSSLCSFVLSLKKKDGGDYTSGSLFSVITALQKHFEINGKRVSFLNDYQFNELKNCLDNTMQSVTRQGVGLEKKQAQVITLSQENDLWEKGLLGTETPQALLHTVFWIIGVNFGLRGGDEHRNLTLSNFKLKKDEAGVEYLEYCESISKTYRGGIKHRKVDPHKARAYEIKGSMRCPVAIFKHYICKLNENSCRSSFYFQALTKPTHHVWFSLTPVGHNKLKSFVKTVMESAGFTGFFTNHSLRATTATRLFQGNVSDQLIMEQTGHRSNAVFSYKRPSDEQKRHVSTILQGSKPLSKETTTTTGIESSSTVSEERHVSTIVQGSKPLSKETTTTTGIESSNTVREVHPKQNIINMSNSEIHIHL